MDKIPTWVKTVFGYYAQGQIDESTLINALEYLIEEKIIHVLAGADSVKNLNVNERNNDKSRVRQRKN